MVMCPLFGKTFVIIICCLVLEKLDNTHASSSHSRKMLESFVIDSIPNEGSSSQYTNDLKKASLTFKKTQGREHQVKIFKKGCADEITNDDTYIADVNSISESLIPNTNNVQFDVEIIFQSNVQNTDLFTIIQEDNVEEDLAQIEVCVRVDVFFVNPEDQSDTTSINFKDVEFIWTIRLDTISVFNMDMSLRSEDYKKFGVPSEWVTVTSRNDENPKKDEICMRLRNEDLSIRMRINEMEVSWTTSSCESSIDFPITDTLDLNEAADELRLCSKYKHSDLVKSSLFQTHPGGGKVTNLCAKIRRHFNPENWEFGPDAGQDSCVCIDLDIKIQGNSRLLLEQDVPVVKNQEIQQGQNINKLGASRLLDDAVGEFHTTAENVAVLYANPYEKEPTPFIASVGLSYETSACLCDETYVCVSDLILSQGSIMYVCLQVDNTQDVIIGHVSEFNIQQQQSDMDITYSPINNNIRDGLTDVIFQGQKAIVKHQLISRYFSDPSPEALGVSGFMTLNFASTSNPSRNRMVRRVVKWKLPSQVETNEGEDDSRELFGRVLGQRKQWSVEVALTGSSTRSNDPDDKNTTGVRRNQVLITLGMAAILAFVAVGIVICRFECHEEYLNEEVNTDATMSDDIEVDGGPRVVGKPSISLSREGSDRTWILT